MKINKLEIISGIVFIIVSLWFLILSINMSSPSGPSGSGGVGPGTFPLIISILLIIFSVILISQTFFKKPADETIIVIKRFKNIILSIIVIIFYGLAISTLGLYLSSAIFFPVLLLLASERNWIKIVSVTILFELFSFVIFETLLQVPLP